MEFVGPGNLLKARALVYWDGMGYVERWVTGVHRELLDKSSVQTQSELEESVRERRSHLSYEFSNNLSSNDILGVSPKTELVVGP